MSFICPGCGHEHDASWPELVGCARNQLYAAAARAEAAERQAAELRALGSRWRNYADNNLTHGRIVNLFVDELETITAHAAQRQE